MNVPTDDDAVIELILPAASPPAGRGLRAVRIGVEVTDTDGLMEDLGIQSGDVILKIGEYDTHDMGTEEVDGLLERVETGELSVMWRTPDGQITAQRLDP